MWLLNTTTLKLHSFFENIPHYVILSHTWGEGEVAFEDIAQPHAQTMAGYDKIIGCCRLAVGDGFKWAWIDTCCIDKRSSAELSEAINSMYKWYWDAAICYAYLSDVSGGPGWKGELETSRWFTRDWTLQELLAPDVVEFYDTQWSFLGTKAKLIDTISGATNIEPKFVLSRETIESASIGTKFSWAAARRTTRAEDMAYCMLGITRVNMPMLYGEGDRAFYRLQLEIIRQTNDHTIFAWEPGQTERKTTTMLAPSPTCFKKSAGIYSAVQKRPLKASTYEITNNGLRAALPVIRIGQERLIALLDCKTEDGDLVGIWLEAAVDGKYQRLSGSRLAKVGADEAGDAELLSMYLVVKNEHEDTKTNRKQELVVSDIIANHPLYVNGITISTRHATTTLQDILPLEKFMVGQGSNYGTHTNLDSEHRKAQIRFLLDSLVIQEGEVACIRYAAALGSNYRQLLLGLRNGRPAMRLLSDSEFSETSWSAEMRTNATGVWDMAADYISEAAHVATSEIRAKKKYVEGKIQWRVTIEVRSCLWCEKWLGNSSLACACPRLHSQDPNLMAVSKSLYNQYFRTLHEKGSKKLVQLE
jgi:hypothetical protein